MINDATIYDAMSPQFSGLGTNISYLPIFAITYALGYVILALLPAIAGRRLTVSGGIGATLVLIPVAVHGLLTGAATLSIVIGLFITAAIALFVSDIRRAGTFLGGIAGGFALGIVIAVTLLPAVSIPAFARKMDQTRSRVLTESLERQASVITASGEASFTDPVWAEPDDRQALRDRYETATLGLWRAVWRVISDEPAPEADSRPWQVATVGVKGGKGAFIITCHYRDGALEAVTPFLTTKPDVRERMPALKGVCPATPETDSSRFVPATDIVGLLPRFPPEG